MNKRIVFLLAVVLAIALGLPRIAVAGPLMINSKASVCVNADGEITCENKMLVNVGVSYGARAMLELQYINSVATAGSQEATTTLEDPLKLTISKTPPPIVIPSVICTRSRINRTRR